MQWSGTELQGAEWFTSVAQSVIVRRVTMGRPPLCRSSIDRLVLPFAEREQVFRQIGQVLPDRGEMAARRPRLPSRASARHEG
nr:unknown hypothetical protein [Streptomyces ambofaciens ATCC 23877]CAI78257.1 unknown hypothetical protein [Streptomyces ambofaciens ATCC 23877]CAJ87764.1 hypothetical protein SAMT0055 [Streptomyces ambofaciens ATCC 23877]CAJ89042.1 hypothetical protein SAMT0055 [Streptomyces ambofaciens ATCC 23877]